MTDLFQKLVLDPLRHCIDVFADRNAFCIAGVYYTYRQFGEAIEMQQKILEARPDSIIPLEVRDDLETYATIFACWMEGKAYVPINPSWPESRKQQITNTLTHSHNNTLAYILFTSGSTGVPKGVAISRTNVGAFMDSFWKTGIKIDKNDRCLQCFDLTFDVSVQSFLVALTRGACVYTVPYGQVKYLNVASLIHEQHITFGAMAPSMLTYLRPYFDELDASSFKTCILTAEACPADLIEDWRKCAKNVEVYDFYGPTEATIYCTYYLIPPPLHTPQSLRASSPNLGEQWAEGRILSTNGMVSIGKPLANVEAVIIDEQGDVVTTACEKGELCVAGDQVTQGYWNNEEKNAEVFFAMDAKRFYRTGDLCYWDKSGNIMYVGRLDQQVKIQGFRVELSEVEYHARQYYNNDIRVVAVAFKNENNLDEIALFVEKSKEASDSLLAFLKEKMPQYMIPSRIVYLENFPQNSSDKIDRKMMLKMISIR